MIRNAETKTVDLMMITLNTKYKVQLTLKIFEEINLRTSRATVAVSLIFPSTLSLAAEEKPKSPTDD